MRKTTACISISEEDLVYLREHGGISQTIESLVALMRGNPAFWKKAQNELKTNGFVSEETTSETRRLMEAGKIDREVKIRAYLQDHPHIVYMAKTQRKFKKSDLCRIKDELIFSKYEIEVTTLEIRDVLKEEMKAFDVQKYEEERGILPKVKK